MDNGIGLADVSKELVSQALAARSSLDEARYVYYLARGRHYAARMNYFGKFRQALVGDGDDTHVGFYSTKREVCCLCLRTRQAVEQCGLAHIGQSDNTTFQCHFLSINVYISACKIKQITL